MSELSNGNVLGVQNGIEYQLENRLVNGEGELQMSKEQLSEFYEPKSMDSFMKVFKGEHSNLFRFLNTDAKKGISDEADGAERFNKYGDNRLPERPLKSFATLAWEAFNDNTMLLLTAAAVVSFALGLYEVWGQPPEYDPEGNRITKVDWIEGIAIMIAVVVVVLVGAINDYQKEKQFVKLNRKKEDRKIVVIRNGEECLLSVFDLLVGDLIILQTGDIIPADCILIHGKCEADESSVTGESDAISVIPLDLAWDKFNENPVDPESSHCFLISGSRLLSGLGRAIVTCVGPNSVHGKTMMSLKQEAESTPLQERLNELTDSISVYGCIAALVLFLVLFVKFVVNVQKDGKYGDLTPPQKGEKFMNIFITAVTIIVVAVPEGLPLAVTLALAFATTRMTKDGNLVRVLSACETMGSATAVCSDKTGTLTENVMTVTKGFVGNSKFDDEENLNNSSNHVFDEDCASELKMDFLTNIALNSTAFENKEDASHETHESSQENPFNSALTKERNRIGNFFNFGQYSQDSDEEQVSQRKKEEFIGSKTETALLSLAKKSLGMKDVRQLRENPRSQLDVEKVVQVIPFESSRKWGGIVVKCKEPNTYRFFIKGAAEIVFSRCQYRRESDNQIKPLTRDISLGIQGEIKSLASGALRAISLAHKNFRNCKSWPPKELLDKKDKTVACEKKLFGDPLERERENFTSSDGMREAEDGLILDGIVGIQDPLRSGVKESIEQCQNAGVTVRMVTGDNVMTAKAIARNCGILSEETFNDEKYAMEGPQFRKLPQAERLKILPKLRVLARSSPEDKRVLVKTLKEMKDVVAVTGDGTNDAPALKLADVGFSMGISGTEVAREASDIILMTDDFSAIVNAIKWGRCVSVSIKKFIQFQLTVNITAVVLTFVSSVSSEEEASVLTAVQLLWVNLIMDTLAALALATDKPDPNIMDREPMGRTAPLITVSTWKMILSQSSLQLLVTFVLTFQGQYFFFSGKEALSGHEREQLNACIFNTFVWLQFFTLLASRKLDEGDGITNWRRRISQQNLNFFQDLFRNGYFISVMSLIAACQILIMFYGGVAFSIAEQTTKMWTTAIACGLLSLPMAALVRICPDEWCLKVFPGKFLCKVRRILTFNFLRNSPRRGDTDEESLLGRDGTPNSEGSTDYE